MNKLYEQIKEPFTIIENYIFDTDILDYKEKWVFACLKRYANKDGTCFPSIQKIVHDSKLSKSTVKRAIKPAKKSQ